MTLLIGGSELKERGRTVHDSALQGLASSLYEDLSAAMVGRPPVPDHKALLSREGGRCPTDGTMLDFDPYSPHRHRCPSCGVWYEGELHDRFWIYWCQLWLAERAIHAATLGAIVGDPKATDFAVAILDEYCDRYPHYPNVDNALGPTRPFFSTYLESIWLLQLCVAADVAESQLQSPVFGRFRDVIVEPSARLIESFDEGMSNRQVWNNAALIAACRMLGRDADAERLVWGDSGLVAHLNSALLPDGTWYEGENYHFFAHRGLWYGIQLATQLDAEIPPRLIARFDEGFRAPFLTTLPDLTFPSRRDSQYAVSLRQWRFAETCELGLARRDDRLLRAMLSRMYAADIARGDTGRSKSTAEAERNIPATRLERSDLGWKALLFAKPELDLHDPTSLPSVLLEAQGVGVIRRAAGRLFVALDYGVSGGGHGHPDRLNLLLMNGHTRVLDDMGTGAYVHPSLHWYRSTLAHNAPLVDGRSQRRVDGRLIAYEDRGAAGWIEASAPIADGVIGTRTVVVMTDYIVDELTWSAAGPRRVDLPLHSDLRPASRGAEESGQLEGGDGLEDGFRHLRDTVLLARVDAETTFILTGPQAEVWIGADVPLEVWRAVAPAAPGQGDAPFVLLRGRAERGVIRAVWSWNRRVGSATTFPAVHVTTGTERHEHARVEHGWNIAIHVGAARSTIDLGGLVAGPPVETQVSGTQSLGETASAPVATQLRPGGRWQRTLGKDAYRRSEQSWEEAGAPTADVEIVNEAGRLRIIATVHADGSFVGSSVTNRLDNEHADINGAGLQLYLRSGPHSTGSVIVPIEGTSEVTMRPIEGWGTAVPVTGTWASLDDGYRIDLVVDPPTAEVAINLIVNEKPYGRERRRGQLVLIGRGHEWVYLRGDRLDPPNMTHLRLVD